MRKYIAGFMMALGLGIIGKELYKKGRVDGVKELKFGLEAYNDGLTIGQKINSKEEKSKNKKDGESK